MLVGLIAASEDIASHSHEHHTIRDFDFSVSQGFGIIMNRWPEEKILEMKQVLPRIVVSAVRQTHVMMKSTH